MYTSVVTSHVTNILVSDTVHLFLIMTQLSRLVYHYMYISSGDLCINTCHMTTRVSQYISYDD